MDTDSDLPKARGFLLAYSTFVFLAWYFGATLVKVSMLGVPIEITRNAENVWLMLAIANVYFLIRYLQKLPKKALLPDAAMREYAQEEINEAAKRMAIKDGLTAAKAHLAQRNSNDRVIKVTFWDIQISKISQAIPHPQPSLYDSLCGYLAEMRIDYWYANESGYDHGRLKERLSKQILPRTMLRAYSTAFIKGVIKTPWFTDTILPIIIGVCTSIVATVSWLLVV